LEIIEWCIGMQLKFRAAPQAGVIIPQLQALKRLCWEEYQLALNAT
jgi:hypothetical protein